MDSPLVYLSALFVLGIAAQWLAWRLKLPAILLLLAFGFAANLFVDPTVIIGNDLLFPLVSLSVAVILFDGGLSLRFSELKSTSKAVGRLVTVGCVITWILGTFAARLIFDSWWISILAGAIYTVTGPTVIGPLLRHIRPSPKVSSIAKWEGIVIDPIGALLAVLVSTAAASSSVTEATMDIIISVASTIAISGIVGVLFAYVLILMFRRHMVPDYLQNPVLLASVLAAYTLSDWFQHESGLATVTVLGILMANQKSVVITHIIEFKENLGVLLISVLFILLASRYPFGELLQMGWPALLFLIILIAVIRPISVMIATIGTGLNWKERVFLSFLAPRGIVAAAVAAVFALEFTHMAHLDIGLPEGTLADVEKLVPLTFVVIVGTVAFYGLAAGPIARKLGIAEVEPQGILFGGASKLARMIAHAVHQEGFRVMMVDTNHRNISESRMLGLPTVTASILSEFARKDIDLSGLGRFVAMTPNDQVNMLAADEFQHVFDRSELYQLKPDVSDKQRQALSPDAKRARYIFSGGTTYKKLTEMMENGFQVKATKLTEEYPHTAFKEKYGEESLPLFLIDESKKLSILTDEDLDTPRPGQTLIAFVPDQTYAKMPAEDETVVIEQEQETGPTIKKGLDGLS